MDAGVVWGSGWDRVRGGRGRGIVSMCSVRNMYPLREQVILSLMIRLDYALILVDAS